MRWPRCGVMGLKPRGSAELATLIRMPRRPMSNTILLGVELVEEEEHPVLDDVVACTGQAAHGAVVAQQ
eukprot:1217818-Pyramimonas_sp.AAC.1